ncbi:MAG: 16S rRNA (cytosine(1402)-N(4))-methyltransferase [Gammaproteobacteria bacterium]|nr:16S rRNA (cytosine(1402)-N(4))-methyltransferase [Gammaproteobacteria bacterium]
MALDSHKTVLLDEAVAALLKKPDGTYVDCTYGRGGHSQEIANRMNNQGRLMVIDKDQSAIADARVRFKGDDRVVVVHGSFSRLAEYVDDHEMRPLDGILLDLGVSSPQLDDPLRGFSFMKDGPLDMRMDQAVGESASEWLAVADENEITDVLRRYGEEKFARRIAKKIVSIRQDKKIETTSSLVEVIESAIPKREKNKHPATRTFQAVRIQVNQELKSLEDCLQDVVDLLVSGGRLVVISFHSLEDRIVKRFIRRMEREDDYPDRFPIRADEIEHQLKSVGKPIRPGDEEVRGNRRSRSSIMRVAERL